MLTTLSAYPGSWRLGVFDVGANGASGAVIAIVAVPESTVALLLSPVLVALAIRSSQRRHRVPADSRGRSGL